MERKATDRGRVSSCGRNYARAKRSCDCLSSSYFNESSEESDGGGESEEAIKQRIAREFGFGGSKGKEQEDDESEEEEADPLEAFMAGIEVCVCAWEGPC